MEGNSLMNIVYASDDKFAEILGISLLSLFETNSGDLNIYILDNCISVENKNKLLKIAQQHSHSLSFISTSGIISSSLKQQRGSLSTFSRLYLPILLPTNIRKVLYLDCDILVRQNLEELYNIDISDYFCAAVMDCLSAYHLRAIGLQDSDTYFNAGVLLINLSRWREENIMEEFKAFTDKFHNKVPYADQGILNGVLSPKMKTLPLKYNCYTSLYDFSYSDLIKFRKPSHFYSEKEINNAKKNPAIVHFTTSFLSVRPWVEGCIHPNVSYWLKYKTLSPWCDMPLKKDSPFWIKKVAVKIYMILPNSLAVGLVGILHARIIPTIKKRRK